MAKDKFLLVSLKEAESKKLAQVISNSTCRKILDFMSEKESVTETDIANALNMNISTVHYNLQHLKKGGLIESEDFHYSKKGREVHHWKLVNKYIIIAPGKTWGLKEKLKSVLPVLGIAGGVSLALQFVTGNGLSFFGRSAFGVMKSQHELAAPIAAEPMIADNDAVIGEGAEVGARVMKASMDAVTDDSVSQGAVDTIADSAGVAFQATAPGTAGNYVGIYVFIGALLAVGLYLLIDYLRHRK